MHLEKSAPKADGQTTRRNFLIGGARLAGASWVLTQLPLIVSISGCARDRASRLEPLRVLTEEEARTTRALASQILPSDELPGAEEAGTLYFIDRALEVDFAGLAVPLRAAISELDNQARAAHSMAFADLDFAQQTELVRGIENAPYFGAARLLVVLGTFSLPERGGNRDGAGWRILGMSHEGFYTPPFGFYDEAAAKGSTPS